MDPHNGQSMDLFLESCAAATGLWVDVACRPSWKIVRRVFAQPFLRIGGHRKSDLLLGSPRSLPCHTYLQKIGGRVFFAHFVNSRRVSRRTQPLSSGWLGPGSSLRTRHFWLQLSESLGGPPDRPADENPLERASALKAGLPVATLELLNGTVSKSPRPITRLLTLVGKSASCGLRVIGASVSDFHCSLLCTPQGVWVVDLLGPGGIYVNEKRVAWARLNDDDRLLVGKFHYRLRYHDMGQLEKVEPLVGSLATLPGPARPSADLPALPPAWPPELSSFPPEILTQHLHQFGLLQQQMFDQFHQAMRMTLEMFSDLRRDEAAAVREELGRLQELTHQLRGLQDSLERKLNTPPQQPARGPLHAALSNSPDAEVVSVTVEGRLRPEPAGPAAPADQDPRRPVPVAGSSEDALAWVCQRMASLQEERQNLWQKVVSRLWGLGRA